MPDLIPQDQSDQGSTADSDEHHAIVFQGGYCCNMDIRNNTPDDKDPDTAGILELEEDDNELPETRIANWVANHIATISIDGIDGNHFGPMDV